MQKILKIIVVAGGRGGEVTQGTAIIFVMF